MSSDVAVRDAAGRQRYEVLVDGEVAGFLRYRGDGAVRVLEHTEIDDRFKGQGLGGRLVKDVLDDVRAHGSQVVPRCPFVRRWLGGHPEYHDVVVAAQRAGLGSPA